MGINGGVVRLINGRVEGESKGESNVNQAHIEDKSYRRRPSQAELARWGDAPPQPVRRRRASSATRAHEGDFEVRTARPGWTASSWTPPTPPPPDKGSRDQRLSRAVFRIAASRPA